MAPGPQADGDDPRHRRRDQLGHHRHRQPRWPRARGGSGSRDHGTRSAARSRRRRRRGRRDASRDGAIHVSPARSASSIRPRPASGWPGGSVREIGSSHSSWRLGAVGPSRLGGRVLEADGDVQPPAATPAPSSSAVASRASTSSSGSSSRAPRARPARSSPARSGTRPRAASRARRDQLRDLRARQREPLVDHVARARAAARPPRSAPARPARGRAAAPRAGARARRPAARRRAA